MTTNNLGPLPSKCSVAIIGGGTSGLAISTELKRLGVDDVIILERENVAGGVPRHCGHYPFGVMEFKRLMKGPQYARTLVKKAEAAGVKIFANTTVTALHEGGKLSLTTPDGTTQLQAQRVVLSTGIRESTRAQRFIGGQRPTGVMSTGALQSLVYLQGEKPFQRPIILGTELVSFSAIMTCRHMGMKPVAMVEENNRVTVHSYMRPYPAMMGVPIKFGARELRIVGDECVEGLEYLDPAGKLQFIEGDGIIVSGKFRPESALLGNSHLAVDAATGGPIIDQFGRSSDPAYFCTGNLLRPVETSSWCWHEAVETAHRLAQDLNHSPKGNQDFVEFRVAHPAIKFVLPQRLIIGDNSNAMTHMQIRLLQPFSGKLVAQSGETVLASKYIKSRPERRILLPLKNIYAQNLHEAVEITLK